MSVRSSTSSFDTAADRLRSLRWLALLGGALLIAATWIAAMEIALRVRGFRPTIVDSQAQWEKERARAANLGNSALVLVGDSRMLSDFDLAALQSASGLSAVELGIDGASFVPVLAGLARDTRVTGTVLVGYSEAELMRDETFGTALRYEQDFERASAAPRWNYRNSEAELQDRWHALFASYGDGARPLTTLLMRILDREALPQSIVTEPDRTRFSDFSRANLRSLNQKSAAYELDGDFSALPKGDLDERERYLLDRIAKLQPADAGVFAARSAEIESAAKTIRKRGGAVIFVALPTGGHVAEIDERQFPRATFWDRSAAQSEALWLRCADHDALREFIPPDGLHLDGRDRQRFSRALGSVIATQLQLRR
jgi:hypothetical protein